MVAFFFLEEFVSPVLILLRPWGFLEIKSIFNGGLSSRKLAAASALPNLVLKNLLEQTHDT